MALARWFVSTGRGQYSRKMGQAKEIDNSKKRDLLVFGDGMENFNILRVKIGAAPEVTNILRDAALWLNRKGIVQWSDFLNPEQAQMVVNKRFAEGEVFLGYLDGIAAATITLQWKDEFWGELGSDPSAGYIHTMAVKREYAGRGIGGELLNWADDYFEQGGRTRTRLDCIEKNERLCRFYDDLNFKTIGRKDWNGIGLLMKERQ